MAPSVPQSNTRPLTERDHESDEEFNREGVHLERADLLRTGCGSGSECLFAGAFRIAERQCAEMLHALCGRLNDPPAQLGVALPLVAQLDERSRQL